jgi:cytochrome c oxidase subunit 4
MIVSRKTYVGVFAALLALTATTVAASFVNLGPFNPGVALTIAGLKAALVVIYFMHVRYSSGLTKVFVAGGIFWLGVLLVLTMSDVLTRNWLPPM